MILLAAALALATERPVLDEAADAACPARGIRAGAAYTPGCDGVALSLARARWYAEIAVWADEQRDLRELDAAVCAAEARAAEEREAWWRAQAERPAPVMTPAAWFGVGAGVGVATVIVSALAVRWASEVPVTP